MARFVLYAEREAQEPRKIAEAETLADLEDRIERLATADKWPEGAYPVALDTAEDRRLVYEGPGEWHDL